MVLMEKCALASAERRQYPRGMSATGFWLAVMEKALLIVDP
jgi:hypothetical protein